MLKLDRKSSPSDPWRNDPNFLPNEGPKDTSDQFSQPDTPPGIGLRRFIARENHETVSDNRTSETLAKGIYLRRLRDGSWEVLKYEGRSTYMSYPVSSREEGLEFFENNFRQQEP